MKHERPAKSAGLGARSRGARAPGRAFLPQTPFPSGSSPLDARARRELAAVVPGYLARCRWFGGKARTIRRATVIDTLGLDDDSFLALARVDYQDGGSETYVLAVAVARARRARRARRIVACHPQAAIATDPHGALLYDALVDRDSCRSLLELFQRRGRRRGGRGELHVRLTRAGRGHPGLAAIRRLAPRPLGAEQSNTSIAYGDKLILKLLRRLDTGPNLELEVGRFLTERCSFAHAPRLLGWLEHRHPRTPPTTMAVLQEYVPNRGDAWRWTLEELRRYLARALAARSVPRPPAVGASVVDLLELRPPAPLVRLIGTYHEAARLLGTRTAELHLALASDADDPDFAPERGSTQKRQLASSLRTSARGAMALLRRQLPALPASARGPALQLLRSRGPARLIAALRRCPISIPGIRCHGDFHLGQVLCTARDFLIIDFEGEPARPLEERRRKRVALCDVAGMLRSFHYAASSSTRELVEAGVTGGRQRRAAAWASAWQTWVSRAYLLGYLQATRGTPLAPATKEELRVLLDALLLEKALYELGYELNNRPTWVGIPLEGILQLCRG